MNINMSMNMNLNGVPGLGNGLSNMPPIGGNFGGNMANLPSQ